MMMGNYWVRRNRAEGRGKDEDGVDGVEWG